MTNNCPDCGLSLALVGRNHICKRNPEKPVSVPAAKSKDTSPKKSKGTCPKKSGTYRYRDDDAWRAYMREYMRKRRATA